MQLSVLARKVGNGRKRYGAYIFVKEEKGAFIIASSGQQYTKSEMFYVFFRNRNSLRYFCENVEKLQ